MTRSSISPEVREVIARAGASPRGLAFLDQGDLESVAITFHTHPAVIVEIRRMLGNPTDREWLLDAARRARDHLRAEETARHARRREARAADHPPRSAPELIRAAQSHALGFSFLMQAPLETAAVTFQVHPDLVLQARAVVTRCRRLQESRSKLHRPGNHHSH